MRINEKALIDFGRVTATRWAGIGAPRFCCVRTLVQVGTKGAACEKLPLAELEISIVRTMVGYGLE
jgi:hypothetical protein